MHATELMVLHFTVLVSGVSLHIRSTVGNATNRRKFVCITGNDTARAR